MKSGGQLTSLIQQFRSPPNQQLQVETREQFKQVSDSSQFQSTLQEKINRTSQREPDQNINSDSVESELKPTESNQKQVENQKLDQQDLKELKEKLESGEGLSRKEIEQLLALIQDLAARLQDKLKLAAEEEEKSSESLQKLMKQLQQQVKKIRSGKQKTEQLKPKQLLKLLNQQTKVKNKSTLVDLKSLQIKIKQLLEQMEQVNNRKLQLGGKYKEIRQLLKKLNGKVGKTKISQELVDKLKAKQVLERKALAEGKLARVSQQSKQSAKSQPTVPQPFKSGKSSEQSANNQPNLQLSQLLNNKQTKPNTAISFDPAAAKPEGPTNVGVKISSNLSTNLEMFTSTNSNLANVQSLQSSLQTTSSKGASFSNILQQVNQNMNFFAAKRGQKVTLQLKPKSLGKLQLKIGVNDGTISAKVVAESSQVKEMLNNNLSKLKQALEQKDIYVDQFEVAVDEEGRGLAGQEFSDSRQQFEFDQNSNQHQREEMDLTLEDVEVEEIEAEGEKVQVVSKDSIDYVV